MDGERGNEGSSVCNMESCVVGALNGAVTLQLAKRSLLSLNREPMLIAVWCFREFVEAPKMAGSSVEYTGNADDVGCLGGAYQTEFSVLRVTRRELQVFGCCSCEGKRSVLLL